MEEGGRGCLNGRRGHGPRRGSLGIPSGTAGLTLLVLVAACATGTGPAAPMAIVDTWIVSGPDSIPLTVEVAATTAQAEQGLMDRTTLAPDAGLLFLFDEPRAADDAFWMWRTLIPLDLAALDREGRILVILPMDPCREPDPDACTPYVPGVVHAGALEMNQGWFSRHGVEVGDRVRLPGGGG